MPCLVPWACSSLRCSCSWYPNRSVLRPLPPLENAAGAVPPRLRRHLRLRLHLPLLLHGLGTAPLWSPMHLLVLVLVLLVLPSQRRRRRVAM